MYSRIDLYYLKSEEQKKTENIPSYWGNVNENGLEIRFPLLVIYRKHCRVDIKACDG